MADWLDRVVPELDQLIAEGDAVLPDRHDPRDARRARKTPAHPSNLCGAPYPNAALARYHCTLDKDDHGDEHLATIGPYSPDALVIVSWPVRA